MCGGYACGGCVYVKCLHMCRHSRVVEVFVYMACTWASESIAFHLIFWDWQGWISNGSQGFSCLSFPTKVIDTLYWYAGLFIVMPRVQTQAIYLVSYFPQFLVLSIFRLLSDMSTSQFIFIDSIREPRFRLTSLKQCFWVCCCCCSWGFIVIGFFVVFTAPTEINRSVRWL